MRALGTALALALLTSPTAIAATPAAVTPTLAPASERIPLWPNGAPGFEARAAIPEQAAEYWTKSVNNPSITAYRPDPRIANGAAVVIVPGGGHRLLVTTSEGEDAARWFTRHGIAAFVLRYRLFREEGSPYSLADARADAERAIRLVRSRAGGFGVDPNRIGIIGFSAGGELARMALLAEPVPAPGKGDAVDRLSARPDFGFLVYPGPLTAPETVAKNAPPVFLVAANDDECCSQPPLDVLAAYRRAGASAELHLYAAGGHAFNMGARTERPGLSRWTDRMAEWLADRGLTTAGRSPAD